VLASAAMASAAVPEYLMKATYLYNFMVFSEWPASDTLMPSAPLNLCVLGPDNFGNALDRLAGKSANGHRIDIVRLSGLGNLRKCHLLFVTEHEAPNMQAIQTAIGDAAVLTVADTPVASGAAILLALDGKRLVFDVNMQRVKKVGVNLSSKVLQLARSTN
jgi:hypothetical protein